VAQDTLHRRRVLAVVAAQVAGRTHEQAAVIADRTQVGETAADRGRLAAPVERPLEQLDDVEDADAVLVGGRQHRVDGRGRRRIAHRLLGGSQAEEAGRARRDHVQPGPLGQTQIPRREAGGHGGIHRVRRRGAAAAPVLDLLELDVEQSGDALQAPLVHPCRRVHGASGVVGVFHRFTPAPPCPPGRRCDADRREHGSNGRGRGRGRCDTSPTHGSCPSASASA
jgi:hypothetical protein